METTVNTASKRYTVKIGRGLLRCIGKHLAETVDAGKVVLVTDDTVEKLYGNIVETSLTKCGFAVKRFTVAHGERSKNAENYIALLNYAAREQLCRKDMILALGGGVVGDLAGFAAATFLRGIRFVQVPTTFLAMVDSSVGGKTSINLDAGKNLAGAFYQPDAVICDVDALATLPKEIFLDGVAEVIKYGAIGDAKLLDSLGSAGNMDTEMLIARCVTMKAEIVSRDERDLDVRQLLNFGHTVGHGVEAASDYAISHGHAVAIGMSVFARAAEKTGVCAPEVCREIVDVIKKNGLPVHCAFGADALYSAALSDKKNVGGSIVVVLPERRGSCGLHKVTHERLRELIALGLE
ncbi:MAG: 3-dehydroquinate synthase [Christensenellales bacterium]|jgi:3-dehydroquinate synthase